MKIEAGKMYVISKRKTHVILVKKNNLPEYKFSVEKCWKLVDGELVEETNRGFYSEKYKENGQAYHYDCDCNIESEYKEKACR